MAVEAVNFGTRQALLDTGEVVPIKNMIDADGYDTDEPEEALVAIAGPLATGGWLSIDLSAFSFERVN